MGAVKREARGNRDRCPEPQHAGRGRCAPAEGAPESSGQDRRREDMGPRVSPGTEAGGAPAGGPSLKGRQQFPPDPRAGPGQTSGGTQPPSLRADTDCDLGQGSGASRISAARPPGGRGLGGRLQMKRPHSGRALNEDLYAALGQGVVGRALQTVPIFPGPGEGGRGGLKLATPVLLLGKSHGRTKKWVLNKGFLCCFLSS